MTRLRAPDRRRQLLDVASGVFAERGYHAATTAELAAAAGVSEPILYRHFASKLDLFVTIVDDTGRALIESWRARVAAATTPAARLDAVLADAPVPEDPARLILHAIAASEHDPAIESALSNYVRRLHEIITAALEDLQDERAVRADAPPGAIAWLLVERALGGALVGPLVPPRRRVEPPASAELLRSLLGLP